MNFNTKITREGLSIPKSAAKASSFASWEDLRGHALPQAIVVLKKQMTAKELLAAADSLYQLFLTLHLEPLTCCGQCDSCRDACPFELERQARLSDEELEEMGISLPDHLSVLNDDGDLLITQRYPGLEDVPVALMRVLDENGICLSGLADYLRTGDIVYGKG